MHVLIENLYWNGELLTFISDEDFVIDSYAENIRYLSTGYKQMDKNTVSAAQQLKKTGPVRFFNPEGNGKRVMFVGNSITLHGKKEDIGWPGEGGMAASSKEKDRHTPKFIVQKSPPLTDLR